MRELGKKSSFLLVVLLLMFSCSAMPIDPGIVAGGGLSTEHTTLIVQQVLSEQQLVSMCLLAGWAVPHPMDIIKGLSEVVKIWVDIYRGGEK